MDECFPNDQFKLNGYMKYRQEEIDTKHKGGLIELDRQGSICKILKQYQPNCSESFYLEFNILKKKWICFSIYRSPLVGNIKIGLSSFSHVEKTAWLER